MRADMRFKITIKRLDTTLNEYGERDNGWVDVVTDIWASKETLLGKEYFSAEQIQSNVEIKFRCYYIPGIDKTMRVYNEGDVYEILSVIDPKGLNRELLLYCKKVFI